MEVLFGSFDQALYLMRMISHPSHNFFTVINITSVSNKKNKNKNEKLDIHGGLN